MATEEATSFDDLAPVERSSDENGDEWIDLEPGDEVVGVITDFNPEAGYNGVVEIDGRPMYLTAGMKNDLIAALVEGHTMGVKVSEQEETFEQDGEEQTYHPKEVRFL